MGIQKDAEEIIIYIYKQKIKGEEIAEMKEFKEVTKWEEHRVISAIKYLIGKGLVEGGIVKGLGSKLTKFVSVTDITPFGIDTIENEKEFTKHFNHTIDLKIYKYSWGATEK